MVSNCQVNAQFPRSRACEAVGIGNRYGFDFGGRQTPNWVLWTVALVYELAERKRDILLLTALGVHHRR